MQDEIAALFSAVLAIYSTLAEIKNQMKYTFASLIFCATLFSCNQTESQEKEVEEFTEFDYDLSTTYVEVKGTNFSIIPPLGFVEGENFIGFEGDNWNINIVQIPQKFQSINDPEMFTAKGINLIESENLSINGQTGELLLIEQSMGGEDVLRYILNFGDDDNTSMITGTFNSESYVTGEEIKKSILSVKSNANPEIENVKKDVDFEINISDTKLQYASNISSMEVYNVDGLVPTKSNDKTNLIITYGELVFNDEEKLQFSINNIEKAMENVVIDKNNIKSITIDNMTGFEISAFGGLDSLENKEFGYLVTLFDFNKFYFFYGSATEEFESNKKMFESIVKTFKRK